MQQVADELRRLNDENGRLTSTEVLEAARNPESPLHSHFTWDDSEAAERYRKLEAVRLIRSVRIEVSAHSIPLKVPAYVRDMSAETAGFRDILKVRSETDIARATVIDAMSRVTSAVKRAKTLAIVLGIEDEIERIDEIARGVVATIDVTSPPAGAA